MKKITLAARPNQNPQATSVQPFEILQGDEKLLEFNNGIDSNNLPTPGPEDLMQNSGNIIFGIKFRNNATGEIDCQDFDSPNDRNKWLQENSEKVSWLELYEAPDLSESIDKLSATLTALLK